MRLLVVALVAMTTVISTTVYAQDLQNAIEGKIVKIFADNRVKLEVRKGTEAFMEIMSQGGELEQALKTGAVYVKEPMAVIWMKVGEFEPDTSGKKAPEPEDTTTVGKKKKQKAPKKEKAFKPKKGKRYVTLRPTGFVGKRYEFKTGNFIRLEWVQS